MVFEVAQTLFVKVMNLAFLTTPPGHRTKHVMSRTLKYVFTKVRVILDLSHMAGRQQTRETTGA